MFVYAMYIACSLAGLIMVVGGIWLIAKQKIYIDHETQQPIEVELPGGVRLKANIPALALFLIGFIPLLYPVYKLNPERYHEVEHAKITGSVGSQGFDPTDPVVLYISVVQEPVQNPQQTNQVTYRMTAPFVLDENTDYKVLLVSSRYVLEEKWAKWQDRKNGEIVLDFPTVPVLKHYQRGQVDPVPSRYLESK